MLFCVAPFFFYLLFRLKQNSLALPLSELIIIRLIILLASQILKCCSLHETKGKARENKQQAVENGNRLRRLTRNMKLKSK